MPEHPTHHSYQIHLADAVYEPAEDSHLLIDAARGEIGSAGLLVREVASIRCPGVRLVVLRGSRQPSF